jgi:hypothetical protein
MPIKKFGIGGILLTEQFTQETRSDSWNREFIGLVKVGAADAPTSFLARVGKEHRASRSAWSMAMALSTLLWRK